MGFLDASTLTTLAAALAVLAIAAAVPLALAPLVFGAALISRHRSRRAARPAPVVQLRPATRRRPTPLSTAADRRPGLRAA